jgi:hypothetical protein
VAKHRRGVNAEDAPERYATETKLPAPRPQGVLADRVDGGSDDVFDGHGGILGRFAMAICIDGFMQNAKVRDASDGRP